MDFAKKGRNGIPHRRKSTGVNCQKAANEKSVQAAKLAVSLYVIRAMKSSPSGS